MTKPSEILWGNIGIVALCIAMFFSIKTFVIAYDANQEFNVPVTVKRTYKSDDYQDIYHIVCYSKDYGTLDINTTYDTYSSYKKGDDISFTLSKLDIEGYGGKETTPKLMGFHVFISVIVSLVFLVVFCIYVEKFNKFYDERMQNRKINNKI